MKRNNKDYTQETARKGVAHKGSGVGERYEERESK